MAAHALNQDRDAIRRGWIHRREKQDDSKALDNTYAQGTDPVPSRSFGLLLAIILAFVASAVAAVHSAAGGRASGLSADAALPAVFTATGGGPLPIERRPAKYLGTGHDEANVDALTDATARKYRISSQAMRELVDEG